MTDDFARHEGPRAEIGEALIFGVSEWQRDAAGALLLRCFAFEAR